MLDWMDAVVLDFLMSRLVGYETWKSAKYLAERRKEMSVPSNHETAVFNLCQSSPTPNQRYAAMAMATLLYE